MPYHKIPRARLHEDITAIEREHEVVVQVVPNIDDAFYDVFTRWCADAPMTVHRTTSEHRYGGAA